ncbi:MAG: GNAT family N-acetyltransferase [Rhodospirillaceae bacterium]|jgi:ribosomal protein S18 acetylase RimI-like enzyme|nr:GNAT family N-acetyltransferase [Rhodospirillaceae bacterium]
MQKTDDFTDFVDNDEMDAPARDYIPTRSLQRDDLRAVVRIDERTTGVNRQEYYERIFEEVLDESGIRVSLVAEIDEHVAGFIMARVDYGEFGRTDSTAVIDIFGVDPRYQGEGVGSALMSQLVTNLTGLRIEATRTNVEWNDFPVLAYLEACGFKTSQRLVFAKKL